MNDDVTPRKRTITSVLAKPRVITPPHVKRDGVDVNQHQTRCSICKHERRTEIETAFVDWTSARKIADEFGLPDPGSVYRHARACDLYEKRDKNVRRALGRLIEHAGEIVPNSAAVVQACVALAKINSDGRYVERRETLNLNDIFSRMSAQELEQYASAGTLPVWAQVESKVGA